MNLKPMCYRAPSPAGFLDSLVNSDTFLYIICLLSSLSSYNSVSETAVCHLQPKKPLFWHRCASLVLLPGHCHLNRKSCRHLSCLSMIRIPAFNMLALGMKLITYRMIQGVLDPLFKTHYTVSMSMQAFLLLLAVCPVYYFTDFISSPLTLSSFFSGSVVSVYGTYITNDGTHCQGPTWECFVDYSLSYLNSGLNITSLAPRPKTSINNWPLCYGQFADGDHILTVNVYVTNQSEQSFWFDQIRYAPSANVLLDQSILRIDSTDTAITYSPGWLWLNQATNYTQLFGNTYYTQDNRAWFAFNFSGS